VSIVTAPAGLPKWLRLAVVTGVVAMMAGASLFAYRWYYRPTTLTIAVGSLDGEAARIVSAIAGRLASTNATVRLKVMEMPSALDAANAFSSRTADLAVVRGDVGDLSQAHAVVVVAHLVALLIAPPGSPVDSIRGLKRATVGVVGGEINQGVVNVLTDEYDLTRAAVKFRDLAPPDVRRAIDSKEVQAVLMVVPLAERYLSLIRGLFQQSPKSAPVLIPIDSAGAIAERKRAYESFDVPKGTLRGSPPVPADDLTTVRATLYLVAGKKLDNDLITDLTQALMGARRDLIGELPILTQVTAPDTDADAYLPVHPGAAAFYNGTQQSFLDKWGNAIFLAPMIFGGLVSVVAAGWKFIRAGEPQSREEALDSLYALARRIRATAKQEELSEIEREIDSVLEAQRIKTQAGDANALDVTTLNVAAHRLEYLIHDRRAMLCRPSARQSGLTGEASPVTQNVRSEDL
jgi:TRAP-type uncharacterized transport system substrate-binding protein